MIDRESELIHSSLSREFSDDGRTVKVEIYRVAGTPHWALEVIAGDGSSTIWDDTFATEHDADEEFLRVIAEEGIEVFFEDDPSSSDTLH